MSGAGDLFGGNPAVNLVLLGVELFLIWQCAKAGKKAWSDRPEPPNDPSGVDPYFQRLRPVHVTPPWDNPLNHLLVPLRPAPPPLTPICAFPHPVEGAQPYQFQSEKAACSGPTPVASNLGNYMAYPICEQWDDEPELVGWNFVQGDCTMHFGTPDAGGFFSIPPSFDH